ncbi:MurR/RpiR family transcriptional regulator [Salinisphaera hydrothermalis]|uniref:MurR/RpiR family transcriptional regulator n=1 Tax=Salinisphaera hydrothermalis TaxID=563188 RepID=UPI00333F31F4
MNKPGKDILKSIAAQRESLGKAELRVAEYILKQPEQVITMTIVDLAKASEVSDPTIIRLCRRFGCKGYQDFKVRLAQQLAPEPPFLHQPIEQDDDVERAVEKILLNSINALKRFRVDVDAAAIERAAGKLMKARMVYLFGLGISETLAFDAEHKLFRLGIHCRTVLDGQRQMLIAPNLDADHVALFFSHSGQTRTLVSVASLIGSTGADSIAITAPGSHLAGVVDTVVSVPPYDRSEIYTPLTARLNHLVVINMLVVAIRLKQGKPMPDNLNALDSWLTEKLL